jgi:predicted extracellular nuclease
MVEVGDQIRLGGRVEEPTWGLELPVTRIFATSLEVEGRWEDAPPPIVIGEGGVTIPQADITSPRLESFEPSRFAADAFESLEGMLVRVEEPVVVGPTSRYGEVAVLADSGQSAELRTGRGGVRMLEDNANPQRIIIDDRLVPGPPGLRVGDSLSGSVDGVLHYSFGSYKLLNTEKLPQVRENGQTRGRTTLAGDTSHLTLAAFNLENLSAVSEADKFARLAAVVVDILGAPDIVAVQEVQDDTGPEDDGTVTAARTLELLVEVIETAGGPRYETRSIDPSDGADGGQPGANIRNAFLFDPARVEFVDRRGCPDDSESHVADGPALTCNPGLVKPGNPAFRRGEDDRGGSRKPLVGEFVFAGHSLFLVNLHLKSKGGDDPIFGRRQPRIESTSVRRTEQARVVADFVNELTANDKDARVVVLGDLNDFENSEALLALEAAGLEDLVKRLPLKDRYTYVYLGNSQVLDHVLVSEALAAGAEVETVHVNAEFPAADRASDHDPVIVRLSIQ